MTIPVLKIKVLAKPVIKGKMDVRFPANVVPSNFLTVTKSNGTYTFGVDYTLLDASPASSAANAAIVIYDEGTASYKLNSFAAMLNSTSAVQSAVNDTNIQGSISGNTLTFAWAGTLAAARLNGNVVQAVTNDTNIRGSISAQNLTFSWSGTLAVSRGGTGGGAASGALLDNITGFSSTGTLVRTAAGTYAFRSLTAPAAGITVSNGDGVAGNPTLALANDLAALEGLASTGIARRTGTDAWSVGTPVANSELATMSNNTFKGNVSGSTAAPSDLTAVQVTAALPVATTSAKGLAPVLPNDATKYLDGTGNFTVPAGGGGGTGLQAANNLSDVSDKAVSVRNLAPTDLYNGSTRISSYTDLSRNFFGREYLGAYLNSWRVGGGPTANVVLRGDSTMIGTGLSSATTTAPDVVLKAVALRKGLKLTAVTNSGVSGTNTADWKNTHLPSDLATYTGGNIPKLYVLNYGMNDPYLSGANLTVAQSIANLRAGFALLRGTWTGNQTAVVYVMPNTAYDDTGARNEVWRELFAAGAKEACRDYGVMFVDAYAQLREARFNLLTGWLNATDKVHPADDFSVAIWSFVADCIFQSDFEYVACRKLNVTPASGWTLPGTTENMLTEVNGTAVLGSGYIQKTSPSALAANTVIGTVHSYHVPAAHTQGTAMQAWESSSGNWQYVHGFINAFTGDITVKEAVTLTCARMYFGPAVWNH